MESTALDVLFLEVGDSSRISECRRLAKALAEKEGLPADRVSDVSIVMSEIASNILKHAARGIVQIAPLSQRGSRGVEILAIDRGPGISNPAESFRDGYSTAGTSGTGLGAIRRLSDFFDIHTDAGKGTILVSQIAAAPAAERPALSTAVAARPLAGEPVSGDRSAIRFDSEGTLLMVADGLGHGILAHDAAATAVSAFLRSSERSPAELVQLMHRALRGTRGAAVAVSFVEPGKKRVTFSGLGNISGVVVNAEKSSAMISHNGTAGYEARQIREFAYPWSDESTVVMHSDGLSSNWNLGTLAGLSQRHPAIIAGALYREYGRDRDDACVIVGKRI